jgi:hypothetical protein
VQGPGIHSPARSGADALLLGESSSWPTALYLLGLAASV